MAMIVGAIWIIQGTGVLPTGSFMDGRPAWGFAGFALLVVGVVSFLVRRRRSRPEAPRQPDS